MANIMEFIKPEIQQYAEEHTTQESSLLKQISRETHAKVMMPRMLSGHMQGRYLSFVSHMIKPKTILEIGTYTGYSALCLAEGLADGGRLITVDVNEELEDRVRAFFKRSPYGDVIDFRIGNALNVVPTLPGSFDLVFIDADKENYGRYYDLIIDRVPLNGIILADNVLWSGKVLNDKHDKDTRAIVEFNKKVQQDERVENLLLPIRDGIMMVRKIKS